MESVLEGFTNDIVLDGPAFDVWLDIAEKVIFTEAEVAMIVVLFWPETVSAIIAHVHDLWKNSHSRSQT